MKDKDSQLIWEQYTSPGVARAESDRNTQLFEQYYWPLIDQHGGDEAIRSYTGLTPEPGTSEASQFINVIVYLTDTLSEQKIEFTRTVITLYKEYGVDAIELLEALYAGRVDDVWQETNELKEILKDDYENMVAFHQNKAAKSYTGLTPEPGDIEARQFTNILSYIFDQQTNSKMDLLQAVMKNPTAHLDVAYYLSTEEMSSDQLVGLTDGGSLPF